MTKTKLVTAGDPDSRYEVVPSLFQPVDLDQVDSDVGGSIASVRDELDDAYVDMRTFANREPDEIMRICSGHSARLSELRMRIRRVEDTRRHWSPVRIREIEPTLEELTNQFTIASRRHSVREFEWRMDNGQ